MPKSFCIVFAPVAIAGTLYAFQAAPGVAVPAATFRLTSVKYCLGPPGYIIPAHPPPRDAIVLLLKGVVSFRNLGQTALILRGIYDIVGVIAGRTLREMRLQVFRFGTRPLDTELPKEINNPVDSYHKFIVVPPGNSVDDIAPKLAEFGVYDSSRKRQLDLRGRKLSLQFELGMQRLSPRLAKELTIKWKDFGYVWNLRFTTEPFEFEIPAAPEISDCSHEFRID